jgi:hypothetical protein
MQEAGDREELAARPQTHAFDATGLRPYTGSLRFGCPALRGTCALTGTTGSRGTSPLNRNPCGANGLPARDGYRMSTANCSGEATGARQPAAGTPEENNVQ